MQNSSRYRKPPLRRTRDSFIDDKNLQQQPRVDLGIDRGSQIRRDKDRVRNVGVTLYDIDFAVKSFIDKTMQLKIEDNGEFIAVPSIYANAEKWVSIQKDGFIRDKKGKTIAPLITFRRSSVNLNSTIKRNKVASSKQIAYILQQQYNTMTPYDKFSTQYSKKRQYEYFATPMPDYVDVSYDFIVWCEYQVQLNTIIENFIYYGGQSFGDKNFFKFATMLDSVGIEDVNATGQDRIVKATFQLTVHGYLLPKHVAAESTTKRLVSPNRISFVSEMFGDINSMMNPNAVYDGNGGGIGFGNINQNKSELLSEWELKKQRMFDISDSKAPGVYPSETED